jgi:hypothetical protein
VSASSSPVTSTGVAHIVRNLRPRDRCEVFALRWDDDENHLVHDVCQIAGDLWRIWSWDGEPVAVMGVVPVRPGVVVSTAFGTDKWPAVVRPATRWVRDYLIPILKNSNFHRGEAYSLASPGNSRHWIELLGGEVEALLKGYGRGREDFLLYAWDLTRERSSHVLQQSAEKRSQLWGCH